jgi:outer membrane protein, multidrug efflux system
MLMTSYRLRSSLRLPVLAVCAIVISGCTVKMEPLSEGEVAVAARYDRALLDTSVPLVDAPFDLAEATARALKYNLTNMVSQMETALAAKNFELAKLDMLPVLTASGGFEARNNYDASKSKDLETHTLSNTHTYSDDRQRYDANARFVWNILDFGVSYLQAKQEADRAIIAREAREKAAGRLTQQVRTAFWRAAALQIVAPRIEALLKTGETTLGELDRARAEGLRSPVQVLEQKRALIEIIQQLELMNQSVSASQIELASLVNAPVGSVIALDVDVKLPPLPSFKPDFEQFEMLALVNSSDYTEQIYNLRITQAESRKAILRLFPSLELFTGANFDSNSFLANKSWYEAGARVSFNLFNLLSIDEVNETNEARDQMTIARRLAANMAVITGVHVSYREYADSISRLDRAAEIDNIDREIAQLTGQAERSNAGSGLDSFRSDIQNLRSAVARMLAYADAQDTYGRFLLSLGLVPVSDDYQVDQQAELADKIRATLTAWDKGEFPEIAEPAADVPNPVAAETS